MILSVTSDLKFSICFLEIQYGSQHKYKCELRHRCAIDPGNLPHAKSKASKLYYQQRVFVL